MKKASVGIVVLGILISLFAGCTQPGETMAEGHRRHIRNVRLNQEMLNKDVDTFLMADKPSRLTEYKVPEQ